METLVSNHSLSYGSVCNTSPRPRAGYGALCMYRKSGRVLMAGSSGLSTPRRKQLQDKQQKLPSSAGPTTQKPSGKPTKLLRTWTEGRKISSTSTRVNKPPQKPAPISISADEDDSVDIFALDDDEEEDEDEDAGEGKDSGEDEDEGEDKVKEEDSGMEHHDLLTQSAVQAISIESCTSDLNCQHFKRCSGCVLEKALDQPPILKDAERFFRCHGVKALKLTKGNVWEWRCKAKLAVRGTPTNPVVGLYAEGTHDVVDIPVCRTHHPKINAAVELLKAGIQELGIQPYDEDTGRGELRYVQMSVTTYNTTIPVKERYANGKVQVVLVWNDRSEQSSTAAHLKDLSEFLWNKGGAKSENPMIHSVWANFQTSRTNIIFGGRWRHLLGDQQCWERIGGVDICLTPSSFSQANLQAFESMLRKMQKFVKPRKAVVELYAGSGIIGLSLAATCECRAVRCVEVNKEAKTSFDLSLARLSSPNKSSISWHCADVSATPINWLKGCDVVIMDPPRKGLDPPLIEALRTVSSRGNAKTTSPSPKEPLEKAEKRPWILRAQQVGIEAAREVTDGESRWPDTLIYISCGWEAFKRDCTDLVEGGAWHLFAGHAFNFFPGTDSIEILAVFKRVVKESQGWKRSLKTEKLQNSCGDYGAADGMKDPKHYFALEFIVQKNYKEKKHQRKEMVET
ncbi:hypothetical protein GOP47_0030151 [Adiantum capillus-veneris]|nr:hypothetical protein GOP47_0030151 [Adiantum capillus-veneris]